MLHGLVIHACPGKFRDSLHGLPTLSTGGLVTVGNTRTGGTGSSLDLALFLVWAGAELASWNVLLCPRVVPFLGALLSEAELQRGVIISC